MLNYRRHNANIGIRTLQELSSKAIVLQLGQLGEGIDSRFTCSGKLQLPSNDPVTLAYRQPSLTSEVWSSLQFPGASDAAILRLLDVCSATSSGPNSKDVVDKICRNVFQLTPDKFITSFQLCGTPILQEVQEMFPNHVGLKADLHQLNIYAPNGYLKAHNDTLYHEQLFGSLVVCLPTKCAGGELIVHHQKQVVRCDWSHSTPDTLCWAALISGVEHEVYPVTEGYRVTLTYNLSYHSKPTNCLVDFKEYSFYKQLRAALSNPRFMRDGCILGFNSRLSYAFDAQWVDLLAHVNTFQDKSETVRKLMSIPPGELACLNQIEQTYSLYSAGIEGAEFKQILDVLPSSFPQLRGVDYIVFNSAKLLGLPVCVKQFLADEEREFDDRIYAYTLNDFSSRFGMSGHYETGPFEFDNVIDVFKERACRYKTESITWCQKLQCNQPAGVNAQYPDIYMWCKSVVILIRVPAWSDHRQTLVAASTGERLKMSSKADEDRMGESAFKDILQDYEEMILDESEKLDEKLRTILDDNGKLELKRIEEMRGQLKKIREGFKGNDVRLASWKIRHQLDCILHALL